MKQFLLSFAILLIPFFLFTQDDFEEDYGEELMEEEILIGYINANFQIGFPVEAFRRNLDHPGYGGGGLFTIKLAGGPIWVGGEISAMVYEYESQEFTANIGGFLQDYELRTNSNIFLAHAFIRIQPNWNRTFQPYLDGLIGIKNLFTRTKLLDLQLEEDNVIENNKEQGDIALSYGIAAGCANAFFSSFRDCHRFAMCVHAWSKCQLLGQKNRSRRCCYRKSNRCI